MCASELMIWKLINEYPAVLPETKQAKFAHGIKSFLSRAGMAAGGCALENEL